MTWALVVAGIALALAAVTALVGRRWKAVLNAALDQSDTRLEALEAELRSLNNEISFAKKEVAAAKEQLSVSRENYDEAAVKHARRIARMRPWADVHFAAVDTHAVQTGQLLKELEQYAVRSLEHEAAAGPESRILRGGLYARQPSVLDLGPELVDNLLAALQARVMYRQPDEPHGTKFYLRWPETARPPELEFGSLLTADSAADAPDSAEPGTAQLRAVLHALHDGGPAVLHLGPLIVARTAARMSAGIAPTDWRGHLEDGQKTAAIEGTGPDLMAEIGAEQVADLTEWPSTQTA